MSGKRIREQLEEFGLRPNRALGQNFLCDVAAISAIIDAADIDGKPVLEIGPGLGALTEGLSLRASRVVAVEIDAAMAAALCKLLAGRESVTVIKADFLKADLAQIHGLLGGKPFAVTANLPYYVTTPICLRLIESGLPIESMTLMLQREAAQRFFAAPGERVYGPLAVLSREGYVASRVTELSRESFYPRPDVDSTVVRLTAKPGYVFRPELARIIHAAFSMRRKTILNNLIPVAHSRERAEAVLAAAGIPGAARAETLTAADFGRILSAL